MTKMTYADMQSMSTALPKTPIGPAIGVVDPLEIQLLFHFRALSAYGKKVAVAQMACAAKLCAGCKEG